MQIVPVGLEELFCPALEHVDVGSGEEQKRGPGAGQHRIGGALSHATAFVELCRRVAPAHDRTKTRFPFVNMDLSREHSCWVLTNRNRPGKSFTSWHLQPAYTHTRKRLRVLNIHRKTPGACRRAQRSTRRRHAGGTRGGDKIKTACFVSHGQPARSRVRQGSAIPHKDPSICSALGSRQRE